MNKSKPQVTASGSHIEPPWYRQFWPWLLISIPALTVVAGVITIIIAVKNPTSMVKDNYYKEGLAINASREKEQRALQLGIQINLQKESDNALRVSLSSQQKLLNKVINFELIHPTQQQKDLSWQLDLSDGGSTVIENINHQSKRWYVRVSDTRSNWLVTGTWLTEQSTSLGNDP